MAYTKEELEAMRLADLEIEAEPIILTPEERAISNNLDRDAVHWRKDERELRKAEAKRRWAVQNRAKMLESRKKYDDAHKAEKAAWGRKYRAEHKAEIAARMKEYNAKKYAEDPQKHRDRAKEYYQRNREKILAKRKAERLAKTNGATSVKTTQTNQHSGLV